MGLLTYEIEAGLRRRTRAPLEGRRRLADAAHRRPARQPHHVARGRAQPAQHRRQLPRLRAGRGQEPDADLPGGGTDHGRRPRAVHAADAADELVTEAGWGVPDGLPRGTPAEGKLDADVMARHDEQVYVERDLQDSHLRAHESGHRAHRARTYAGFPVIVGGRADRHAELLFTGTWTAREPAGAAAGAGTRRGRRGRAARDRGPRARPGAAGAGHGAGRWARSPAPWARAIRTHGAREARQRAGGGHRQEARPRR